MPKDNENIETIREMLYQNSEMIKKQQAEIEKIQHTVNDLLYVSQNASWYKKTMHEIEKRTQKNCILNPVNILKNILGKLSDNLYRKAKNSSYLYNILLKLYTILSKISPWLHHKLDHLIWNSKKEVDLISVVSEENNNEVEQCDQPLRKGNPLVSVIVPNYNHAPYLRQRLDSIYTQTYQNFEVILLDDCSKDNSREILTEYAEAYPQKTICAFNEVNVGRVNLQWNKGLSLAKGQYIWIAESDDWCEPDFLEKLIPKLEQQSVMIAFARSIFMQDGKKIWSTEEYLHDLPFDWNKPFVMTAFESVQKGFAVKNLIPNVSSAVFRNIGLLPDEVMNIWKNIKLCGDWIFYLYLIKGGAFAYTNETTNYYRIHKESTSLKVQETSDYYLESETVSCYIAQNYRVSSAVFTQTLKALKKHYANHNPGKDPSDVEQWYHLDKIRSFSEQRYPNVMMCNFSMKMGGGEILPIHLANSLRKNGVSVTFVDCRMDEYDPKVREMLNPGIPLIELRTPLAINTAAQAYGAEIMHSHHANVDKLISEFAINENIKQVITLHGMYEAINKSDLDALLPYVTKTCSTFAYIAEKNLLPFFQNGYGKKCHFVRVKNGLVFDIPKKKSRKELNIPEDAFVLCLVSRARFDKGWLEAVQAVERANELGDRQIHLVLIGEGEAYNKVKNFHSSFIHVLGAKQDPKAYFAMADMGFLPSRFSGESFPLVIIESLMCGKPVLASNVGEISYQLTAAAGKTAGCLFDLENGMIDTEKLARIICEIASDEQQYLELKQNCHDAAKRFDIENVVHDYLDIYQEAVNR